MAKHDIQAGDYFLMPYSGSRRSRLVKAVQPKSELGRGQWIVCGEKGNTFNILLTSCHRCPPSQVNRILASSTGTPGVQHPHPPHRTCPCAECRAYPWKDDAGVGETKNG